MRLALKTCVCFAVATLVAGCQVEVSQSNVNRIVKTVLKTRRSSPSYHLDMQVWKGAGEDREVVHCTIRKDRANTFSYAFRDGMRYWSTPDGCVLAAADGSRAEIFSGLPEPTVDELRTALRWGAVRYIRRHKIIAHLFTREGAWKGHRVNTTPLHPGPFDLASEQFVDKRSRAKVLVVEFDESGKPVRKRLTRSVRIMKRGEFAVPAVPDCGIMYFAPGSGSVPAPKWARAPKPVIERLGSPRPRHSDDLAVYDMSKGGFVFVLFERETSEPLLTSAIAHSADVGGLTVSAWPVGEKFMYRWRDGGIEFSLLGNVPPDVAWEFLVANIPAGKPLASRAMTADVPPTGATPR
jgi:hypothetical protein